MNKLDYEYECKDCSWKGYEYQLEYEQVESCVGDDKLEVCPKCGSQKVFMI